MLQSFTWQELLGTEVGTKDVQASVTRRAQNGDLQQLGPWFSCTAMSKKRCAVVGLYWHHEAAILSLGSWPWQCLQRGLLVQHLMAEQPALVVDLYTALRCGLLSCVLVPACRVAPCTLMACSLPWQTRREGWPHGGCCQRAQSASE